MIGVCVAGVTGWTGEALAPAIVAAADLRLTSGVARSAAGETRHGAPVHATVAEALAAGGVDVLVDYTQPTAVHGHARAALDAGAHVVVGTTGMSAAQYEDLDRRARERGLGVIAAGNFSPLVTLLTHAARLAAAHVERWEIVETGPEHKPDAPSTTSRELAAALRAVRAPRIDVPIDQTIGDPAARGTSEGGTRVHSVRLPGFAGATEVVFGAAGERLVLRHESGNDPEPYVQGTIAAIRAVGERVGLTRGSAALGPDTFD